MIQIRKSADRGYVDHGWLKARHTFSFSDYFDPKHHQFRVLRVINEDRVAPGQGFGEHPHRDMEIITYILEGALEHKDSMGNGSVIRPGDIQRMSAGSGVFHSEFNHSTKEPVHLLQIWIKTEKNGIEPSYEEKNFSDSEKRNRLRLIVSRDGAEGSVRMHQDARLYASLLDAGKEVGHTFGLKRYGWVQIARGVVELNNQRLEAGDGAAISEEAQVRLRALEDAEFLLFDLP